MSIKELYQLAEYLITLERHRCLLSSDVILDYRIDLFPDGSGQIVSHEVALLSWPNHDANTIWFAFQRKFDEVTS